MTMARGYCAGAALHGKAYVSGGWDNGNNYALASVEVYDPAHPEAGWAAAPKMGTPRWGHAAAALVVGGTARVYVAGGSPGGATAEALGAHWRECNNATGPGGGGGCD